MDRFRQWADTYPDLTDISRLTAPQLSPPSHCQNGLCINNDHLRNHKVNSTIFVMDGLNYEVAENIFKRRMPLDILSIMYSVIRTPFHERNNNSLTVRQIIELKQARGNIN